MKKINAKFIAGMLAMALVFGMAFASCEQETVTKEVLVAGPPGSTTTKEVEGVSFAANEKALIGYLNDTRTKPIYVVSDVKVGGNLIVPANKSIVVTDDADIRAKAVTEGIKPKGSNAPQNRGVLFAIGELKDTTPTLTVNGKLIVQDRGEVVLGSETNATYGGKLEIADTGTVIVEKGASIAVTTASEIELVTAKSTLVFENDVANPANAAKLNVVGTIETTQNETVVGTSSGSALIIVPNTGDPALDIKETNVSGVDSTKLGSFNSTAAISEKPTDIASALGAGSVSVTYTGTASITGEGNSTAEIKSGSTLIITGNLTQEAELKVSGALEVADGATVTIGTSGTLAVEAGAKVAIPEDAKVKVASGGVVDLNALFDPPTEENLPPGTGGTSSGKVALEGDIEVASGGTLRLSMGNGSDLPPEIDWTAGGSVTIESGGGLTLATGGAADVPYIAAKDTAGALYTWDDTSTGSITLSDGAMEFSGKITAANPGGSIGESIVATVTSGSEFTVGVSGNVNYSLDGTLVVENGAKVTAKTRIYTYGTLIVEEGANLKIPATTGATATGGVYIEADGEVQVKGTITVEAAGGGSVAGWIELEGATSKLTLLPGGKLDIPTTSSIYTNSYTEKSEPRVSVYAVTGGVVGSTATKAKNTGTVATNWVLTTTDDTVAENVPAITVQLGRLQFATTAAQVVSNASGSTNGSAAGTLTAGPGTAIVFLGAEE
jgi:hypothetical protein